MKFTKRMLATLLTFALALSLALPVTAAVNWDEFKITKQPQNLTIKHGDSFKLSVEVTVPAGVEVQYQWYNEGSLIEGATAQDLHLGSSDPYYPKFDGTKSIDYYQCRITAHDKHNITISQTLTSNYARVTTEKTFTEKLASVTWEPFVFAFGGTMVQLAWSFGLLFPISPIMFLVYLIFGFVKGFKGLF
jgi:hypothetical protein